VAGAGTESLQFQSEKERISSSSWTEACSSNLIQFLDNRGKASRGEAAGLVGER